MHEERIVPYGFGRIVATPFAETVAAARAALADEGFGILTEIDVTAKFKEKLGIDFRPYLILGACNPKLAHQGLGAEIDLGLFLPCNVIVYVDDSGRTVVMAMDPEKMMATIANQALQSVGAQVRTRLERALERL